VAVQTVFNHFATKEELFFDGRTPWVDEPAEVVRARRPDEPPLTALRSWTIRWIDEVAGRAADDERRGYLRTLGGSAALRAFELGLQQQAEQRLGTALAEAWRADPVAGPRIGSTPDGVRLAAGVAAALWVAGARTLLHELRSVHQDGVDREAIRGAVNALTERLFVRLEHGLEVVLGLPATTLDAPTLTITGPARAREDARRAG
jgi:AcrR family transcriptional regulator